MHSIKTSRARVQESNEQTIQRERTPREMSGEAKFLGFHNKKVTFAKLILSELWQE